MYNQISSYITLIFKKMEPMNKFRSVFSFPNPVNEVAARLVAAMVFFLSISYLFTGELWVLILLVYGFAARVATGPTLSPMGILATRFLAHRIATPKLVPGPPKRFAQSIGLFFSMAATITHMGLPADVSIGGETLATALIAILTVFAGLESFLGFCAGCFVFKRMMDWGLIPESVCEACVVNDQS